MWDVLQRQREIQRREAEEQPDADLEDSPDNAFPVALVRRCVAETKPEMEEHAGIPAESGGRGARSSSENTGVFF